MLRRALLLYRSDGADTIGLIVGAVKTEFSAPLHGSEKGFPVPVASTLN